MAKKTKVTQRAREEQWRRRVEQQTRQPGMVAGRASAVDDMVDEAESGTAEYVQADIRPMPSGVATSARTATAPAARAPRASAGAASAGRRTAAAARASRLAFQQTMSIDEEMHYVRSDIRQLIILTAICLAVLIALSFIVR